MKTQISRRALAAGLALAALALLSARAGATMIIRDLLAIALKA